MLQTSRMKYKKIWLGKIKIAMKANAMIISGQHCEPMDYMSRFFMQQAGLHTAIRRAIFFICFACFILPPLGHRFTCWSPI